MRENKFRARIKDVEGHPRQWVYINGVGHDEWYHKNGRYYGDICEETKTQYTGLKDKNGKEIYESDLVSCVHGILKVVWCDYDGSFTFESKGNKDDYNGSIVHHSTDSVEIIGNIFQNKELLS